MNRTCEKCIHYGVCIIHEPCGYYEAERPHGEWREMWHSGRDVYSCTECFETYKMPILYNFCPNCGASMSANDRQVTGKLKEGEAE